ncbi:MAG: tail fiber domain-containing protein [Rhodothermales bacterium]
MVRTLSLAAGILFCLTSPSHAQQDFERITIQGRLTNVEGNPLDSSDVSMTFKLYRDGNLSWTHTQSVDVVDGIFDVAVGPGIDQVGFDREAKLGITLDGDGAEMTPRITLGASPFARALPGFYTVWAYDLIAHNDAYNVVGGGGKYSFSDRQVIGPDVEGVVIAGGGGVAGGHPSPNSALADWATIGGGRNNTVNGLLGTVAGGVSGVAGQYAFVGGGTYNRALGLYATVPGGLLNQARGDYSLAAGFRARAKHEGSFVWNDRSVTSDSLVTTGANQFLIRAAGGVGIGTDSPNQEVTIFDAGDDGDALLNLKASSPAAREMLIGVNQSFGGFISMQTNNALGFRTNGTTWVVIETSGDVRFEGDAYPRYSSQFSLGRSGNEWSAVWATNGTIQNSDRRLKQAITPIGYGLRDVMRLEPVTYEWRAHPEQGTKLGLIAQDVAPIIPEVISGSADENKFLGLNYAELVPVLVKAIQEQQATIEAQRGVIEEFGGRLAELEARMRP